MSWLLESSLERNLLLICLAGGAVALVTTWVRTGKSLLLGLAVALGALVALLLLAGNLVMTDREMVEATLRQIAADVEHNNFPAAIAHVHSKHPKIAARASEELPKYRFERVDIKNNLEITVDSGRTPPTAEARFNVVVQGKLKGGGDFSEVYGERVVPRFVIVKFEKEGDEWKVTGYEHRPPLEGMRE